MPEEKMDKDAAGVEEKERVVLVDDLVAAGDYWLSITDAARVTRRQEITIRRWISAGELPVRRQRMGANKRTRHVRASDLSTLTPIIDPLAAITGAPANADLMSIPLQQAHLLTSQRDFAQRLDQTEHNLAAIVSHLEQDRQTQEIQQHQSLDGLRQKLLLLIHALEEQVVHQQSQTSMQFQEQQGAAERAIGELSHQLAQERALREDADHQRKTTLTALAAQMSDTVRIIADLQAHTEQGQVERHRQAEEIEVRWQRQQEALEQIRTHLTAYIQQSLATVQQQWYHRLHELEMQYESLHRRTEIEQQQRLHLEGQLRRLQMRRRRARRHQ